MEDTSSGPREKIIGLSDSDSSSDEPSKPEVNQQDMQKYNTESESESDQQPHNGFYIVKESMGSNDNKQSAEFGKPQNHNKPRPTFGYVDVSVHMSKF